MKLLIIGGTMFLGRHLVDAALERGHEVTMFNRGKTNPDLFPDVERITGDRTAEADLTSLKGREWDAAIDTCGYVPRVVRLSADALAGSVGHYTFVSSISAYADASQPGLSEDAPVATMEDPTVEEVTGETYGPLKVLCEQAAQEVFGDGALIVRPGLIVGPHDPTDRFTYWVRRMADGGDVLVPDRPDMPVQVIDCRDLATWMIALAEQRASGVFSATGPQPPLTFEATLAACQRAAGSDARITWVAEEFLLESEVGPWMELPLWIPDGGDSDGMLAVDVSKAIAAGMTLRPIEDTAADTLAWDRTREGPTMKAQLTREREAELLAKWAARGS